MGVTHGVIWPFTTSRCSSKDIPPNSVSQASSRANSGSVSAPLSWALSLKDYLSDTRVIMVLPDKNGETIRKGLSIRPSFITKTNGDFRDVIAVLEKISSIAP